MLWILMLFAVGVCGVLGFYDKPLGFNDQIRYLNSGILVALSLGLLLRTWILRKSGRIEKLMARNAELEKMLNLSSPENKGRAQEVAAPQNR